MFAGRNKLYSWNRGEVEAPAKHRWLFRTMPEIDLIMHNFDEQWEMCSLNMLQEYLNTLKARIVKLLAHHFMEHLGEKK